MQGCLGGREEGRGGKWPVNDRLQLSIILWWVEKVAWFFLTIRRKESKIKVITDFCDAQMNIVLDPMFMIKLTVFLL